MVPFKPSEIRIIAVLSLLALAGSALTIIQRQGKASRFDLSLIPEKSNYRYTYRPSKQSPQDDSLLAATLTAQAQIPEANVTIDINQAGLYDFEALPGIGPSIAQNIISHRDSIGRFTSIEELLNVRGIGPAKFAALKGKVIIK